MQGMLHIRQWKQTVFMLIPWIVRCHWYCLVLMKGEGPHLKKWEEPQELLNMIFAITLLLPVCLSSILDRQARDGYTYIQIETGQQTDGYTYRQREANRETRDRCTDTHLACSTPWLASAALPQTFPVTGSDLATLGGKAKQHREVENHSRNSYRGGRRRRKGLVSPRVKKSWHPEL